MEKLTNKRKAREAKLKALKQAIGGEKMTQQQYLMELNNSTDSQGLESEEENQGEESEYSGVDEPTNGDNTQGTGSCENYEIKSLDDQQYQVTERKKDPEFEAKEEYMRKLMSFRKDELVLPESSDDELDEKSDTTKKNFNPGVEDAYELVETIDFKMNQIANVIRGMDKRMSYNLRLIGSVVMQNETTNDDSGNNDLSPNDEEKEALMDMVKKKTIVQRKQKIVPRIKKMSDFTIAKFKAKPTF